jgi:hypothetical protein
MQGVAIFADVPPPWLCYRWTRRSSAIFRRVFIRRQNDLRSENKFFNRIGH